jgi:Ni/Fe-hydrogenase subunit HybB-like protein
MADTMTRTAGATPWVADKLFMGLSPRAYLRSLLTPGNLLVAVIFVAGIQLMVYRFYAGLGAVTNLSQTAPWGLWIGFDMLSGVALAAGGYTIAAAVHIFGLKEYRPIVRPAVLTGFLGYLFAVFGLLMDLGQPWRIPYPIFYSAGPTSVMFEVGWCVCLYTTVLFIEFTPPIFEWLGLKTLRNYAMQLMLAATVLGVVLSTLHQSSLGALFLMAPTKLHPLWYSPFMPLFFFISSVVAGLSMVIVESALSHKIFRDRLDPTKHVDMDGLTIGLAKGASVVLFAYFFLLLQGVAEGDKWHYLATPYGYWYMFEIGGFVLLPCLLYAHAARTANARLARGTAVLAIIGIVLNRLNVSIIAMNWNAQVRYVPTWMEVVVSITIVTMGVMVYRWIVNRMPVLQEHPDFVDAH